MLRAVLVNEANEIIWYTTYITPLRMGAIPLYYLKLVRHLDYYDNFVVCDKVVFEKSRDAGKE